MPTLNIGGHRVKVDDSFLGLSPDEQSATVEEIAATLGPGAAPAAAAAAVEPQAETLDPERDISTDNVVRSAARGVPVIGGVLNKANAALNAALAPVIDPLLPDSYEKLPQGTMGERYDAALAIQNRKDKAFDEGSPVASTAAKIAGGVGSTIPLVMAAPTVMGARGSLPLMMGAGAASNAALSGADAAVRGEPVLPSMEMGGALGLAMPVVGRGIGKVVSAFKGKTVPTEPANVTPVAGVDVPVPTTDPIAAAKYEQMRRGAAGEPAQRVVQEGDELTAARLTQATDNIGGNLGTGQRLTPGEAADRVGTRMSELEQARFQTEQAAAQRAALAAQAEREGIRSAAGQVDPAMPQGVVHAETPSRAAEILSGGVQTRANEARAATNEAYRAKAAVPGEWIPAALQRIGTSIRNRISAGAEPVRVTEKLTPNAHEALRYLDENVGSLRFQNDAQTGQMILDAAGRPIPRPITGVDLEEARKQLVAMATDARNAARLSGQRSDSRAMRRIMDAFDEHVTTAARNGGFTGDAEALLRTSEAARQAHTAERSLFGKAPGNDPVGRTVETILGRNGPAAGSDEIVKMAYGSAAEPGGSAAMRVAQRLRQIVGANSPEWGAYKQGLISHVIDDVPGKDPRTPIEVATRIDKFLRGTTGGPLAQFALSRAEREALAAHAQGLRNEFQRTAAGALQGMTDVEKIVARISGRDGSPPLTTTEIADYLFGRSGAGDKGLSVRLAQRIKRDMPEQFNDLRQGMWTKLTDAGEGKLAWGHQKIAQRLNEFLSGNGSPLAQTLYTAAERKEMKALAEAFKANIPIPGTTNPSGTGPFLARFGSKLLQGVLPLAGLMQGGFAGAVAGHVATQGATKVVNRHAANQARRIFYGPGKAAPIDPRYQQRGAIAGQLLRPVIGQD